MDLKTATPVIKTLLRSGRNIGLIGQPGVGKTETIEKICAELTAADIFADQAEEGDENRPVRFIPIATTTKESVDVAGLPIEQNGRTQWCPPNWIPTGDEPAVVFLDEFPQAEIPTQLGFQKLIDRALDGVEVSSRCAFIVAGNRPEDNAAAGEIPQHMRNRFSWLEIDADIESWAEWATGQGLHRSVIGFVKWKADQLNTFSADSQAYAYATPRSVTEVARIIANSDRSQWDAIAAATCGEGWAATWRQYREYEGLCPSIEEALKNPDSVQLPEQFGVAFAWTDILAHHGVERDTPERREARLQLVAQVASEGSEHRELAAKCVRDLMARDKELINDSSPTAKQLFSDLKSFFTAT